MERLAVSKQSALKYDVERFTLRKIWKKLEAKKQYQIEITNSSATLNHFYDSENINRAWENIKIISKFQLNRVWICKN